MMIEFEKVYSNHGGTAGTAKIIQANTNAKKFPERYVAY